ncbi:MAG: DNA-3-methyladenine glycosylase [Candidatus Bathyarchaeales archaeon]
MLPKEFYERDPAIVAKEMLGKILVRKLCSEVLSGKIVETEAYYGENDPASKAYRGRKAFNELMFLDVGKNFHLHGSWKLASKHSHTCERRRWSCFDKGC